MTTYYSEEHEWITVEGDIATIGITQHAADQLGEIVFVEQREAGDEFEKGFGRHPRCLERKPRRRCLDL